MDTVNIKDFLDKMSDSITDDQIKLYKEIIDSSTFTEFKTVEEFYFAVIYPFENFISGFVSSTLKNNDDVKFLYKNSQYIDNHFNKLFKQIEGYICSADKSKTIVDVLVNFFLTGKKIKFDYNQEYTYHLPKKIFKTHEEIIDFYEGVRDLYYGDNKKYLISLKNIVDLIPK